MVQFFGILDGDNLAPGDIRHPHDTLAVDDITEAKWILREAYARGTSAVARRNVFGDYPGDIPGGVGESGRLTLYTAPRPGILGSEPDADDADLHRALIDFYGGDIIPAYVLTVGPRGGIRVERA